MIIMDGMPLKNVQQQRRSATGRRRMLFTNLIPECIAQSTERSIGDDNQSANALCDTCLLDEDGKSVGASGYSYEKEDRVVTICASGNQSGISSPFEIKRAGIFQEVILAEHTQCDSPITPLICSTRNDDAGSATCEEVAVGSWFPGQLVWAKSNDFPWWPAQVMDERSMGDGPMPPRLLKGDILVRFFGIYNHAWVNPLMSLSEFDMNFNERSQILMKAFQRGLKEALEYRDSSRLPGSWKISSQTGNIQACVMKPIMNVEFSEGSSSHEQVQVEPFCSNGHELVKVDGSHYGLTRKRKPKMLYEEEERLHRRPDRKVRRRRIMRDLGLVAPYGSPFALNNGSKTL